MPKQASHRTSQWLIALGAQLHATAPCPAALMLMMPIDIQIAVWLALLKLGRTSRLDVVRPHPSGLAIYDGLLRVDWRA